MGKILEHYSPYMTCPYGNGHIGIDIVGLLNNSTTLDGILAFEKGTIEAIETRCNKTYNNNNTAINEWGHSYGNYVLINHGVINGHTWKTRYAHLQYGSNNLLKVGQQLKKGQGIGEMGNTGYADGGHLHFEVIRDGVTIEPYDFVFKGKELADHDKVVPDTSTEISALNAEIKALSAENAKLKETIALKDAEILALKNQTIKYDDLELFEVEKTGKYYMELNEGEKLFYNIRKSL